jgi:polyferredoxin
MLNFFRHIGETGLIVLGVFAAASVFVPNFWCRFLCPYGALLGLTSWMSPTKTRRDPEPCIDCAKCAKACPSSLPVDKLVSIKSVECTGCMECVAVCPAEGALYMGLPKLGAPDGRPRALPAWVMAAGIAVLFFGITGFTKATGHWQTHQAEYQHSDNWNENFPLPSNAGGPLHHCGLVHPRITSKCTPWTQAPLRERRAYES